jgi:eukaryotic-like serine/threonine-protein kinase
VSDEQSQPTPARIGKYEVLDVLGRGGMGVVYRARDTKIGRNVAIKTLTEGFSGNADMLRRFYQEAGHTGNLRHPNIVIIYDFGDEDGLPYIVMEYLDGDPLDRLIREQEPLHLSQKLEIIEQVCSALAYAHSLEMIHRDVKPANIVVQHDGLVKLLDFGIARGSEPQIDGAMTRTGTLVGTPAYMAPERLQGSPFDGRSDIFSAGVVLYQLLTGRLPFDAEYPAILHQILEQDPPPLGSFLSEYPPQLDQILERSLAKKPADRYPTAADMAADLNLVGSRVKSQRVDELYVGAQAAAESGALTEAKQLIRQVLRIDSHHVDAKRLSTLVNEKLRLEEARRRVDQIVQIVEDSIRSRNWDHAQSMCKEGLALDPENAAIRELMSQACAGKERKERIRKFLREAESARAAGDFESASKSANAAAELEPADSKILAICNVLAREAEEQRRRTRLRELLATARQQLSAQALDEAMTSLAKAEELDPANPEILHLRDEITEAFSHQMRRRLVDELSEKVMVALTFDQLQAVMKEVVAALELFPTEPTLLRLKMQVEPKLKEQETRRTVAEVSDSCRYLIPADGVARVREALRTLPGNQDLLDLEFAITQRLVRQQREQALGDHLAKARALLDDHLYLETVKILEQAEKEGFSSPEMTELMDLARSAAAERVSQDLVERSFLEAKRLMAEQNYEAVIRLIPPVLERVDEPSLRRQLEEATRNQARLEERIEQVLSDVKGLCELQLFDSAIGFIEGEAPGVRRAKGVQDYLQLCADRLAGEETGLAAIAGIYANINTSECPNRFQQLRSTADKRKHIPGAEDIEIRLATRVTSIADDCIKKAIENTKQALTAEDAPGAERWLETCSAWNPCASAPVQAEVKAIEAEVSSAKKVLRFRKLKKRA